MKIETRFYFACLYSFNSPSYLKKIRNLQKLHYTHKHTPFHTEWLKIHLFFPCPALFFLFSLSRLHSPPQKKHTHKHTHRDDTPPPAGFKLAIN
jgi:hypothetical protein